MNRKHYRDKAVWAIWTVCCAALLPTIGTADTGSSWRCGNPDMEIVCHAGSCDVAESHTPMSVTASATELEVCAYSGCWAGTPGATVFTEQFHVFTGTELTGMAGAANLGHASLTVHPMSGVGTLLMSDGYVQPMVCERA